MSDNAVAGFAILCVFGLPVAAWIIVRTLRFVERMEMIKRGMVPPPEPMFGFGRGRAWRDWVQSQQAQQGWSGAAAPQPPPPRGYPGPEYGDPQFMLFKGIRLTAIGVALVIGLSLLGGTPGTPHFHYGPWILGGLIPMFVGIAQIIVALLMGAQLPAGRARPYVPPPGPGPQAQPGPWQQPPGGWQQPGRRIGELEKPPPPPDSR